MGLSVRGRFAFWLEKSRLGRAIVLREMEPFPHDDGSVIRYENRINGHILVRGEW